MKTHDIVLIKKNLTKILSLNFNDKSYTNLNIKISISYSYCLVDIQRIEPVIKRASDRFLWETMTEG